MQMQNRGNGGDREREREQELEYELTDPAAPPIISGGPSRYRQGEAGRRRDGGPEGERVRVEYNPPPKAAHASPYSAGTREWAHIKHAAPRQPSPVRTNVHRSARSPGRRPSFYYGGGNASADAFIRIATSSTQTIRRGWHRTIRIHPHQQPHPQGTVVAVPEDHDVSEDFFARGRGMWDFDVLLREGRLDERRRARRDAERRLRAEAQRRVRIHEKEAPRRFALARQELAALRSRTRPSESSGAGAVGGRARPDEERKKWKEKEKDAGGDGCCERLLACMQEEAELQHYRWNEMREWNALLVDEMVRSRRQAVPPIHIFNVQGTGWGAQRLTDHGNANVFPRPEFLRGRPPAAEREIRVGFMFLHDGEAVQSRHLERYMAVKGVTAKADTWLINLMTAFYATHVAARRWMPLSKRLALAKFVRYEFARLSEDEAREKLARGEKLRHRRFCTAQRWVLGAKDENSYDRFEYAIHYPLLDDRAWMKKLESLVHSTPSGTHCIIWVYLFERVNYRFMLFLIGVFLLLSTGGGVAYAIALKDISGGLTISTYILDLFGVVTAVWAVGEHLGVERPDMYTYSFDHIYGADDISLMIDNEGDDIVKAS